VSPLYDHLSESLHWEWVKVDNQLHLIKEIACADIIVMTTQRHHYWLNSLMEAITTLTETQGTSNSSPRNRDANMGYDYLWEPSMHILTRNKVPYLAQSPPILW
jgi:ATP:corrinoid adenosyltransferase